MEAKIIKANGAEVEVKPLNGKTFELEQMQQIVGGYIEIVPCKDGEHIIVLNEEGKLIGLPYNEKATQMADIYRDDYIVGDVLWCSEEMVD